MSPQHQPTTFGIQPNGTPVFYKPLTHGHLTITGPTGFGKTEVLRILAAAAHDREELLYILDGKDIGSFSEFDNAMTATTLASAANLLGTLMSIVQHRHELMARRGVEHFTGLPPAVQPEPALVIIDEVAEFLSGSLESDLHDRAASALHELLLSGRAVGVSVVMAAQRGAQMPDYDPDLGALLELSGEGPGHGRYFAGPGPKPVRVHCSML